MAQTHEAQMPFIKNLASSDRTLRTASLDALRTFLAARRALSPADAAKLWKGLYYALWMTDRPLPQQRLTADLAALTCHGLRPACVPAWLEGFWAVMGLQWTDIDNLRMQKFLLLVRRVLASMLQFVKARACAGPDADAVERLLRTWCFEEHGTDLRTVPVGLRMHCLDVLVDELEREHLLADDAGAPARAFVERLGHMVEALKRCPIKPVRKRAAEVYEDERLPWVTVEDASGDDDDGEASDEGWAGFDD